MNGLSFSEVTIPEDRKMYFWEEDLWYHLSKLEKTPEVISIDSLFVDKVDRNRGLATKMLKEFCVNHENFLILLQAGASYKEYADEPSPEVMSEIVNKLVKFYEKRGFLDINSSIGDYKNSTFMVYNNKVAQDTLLKVLNLDK